jgi:hypothetical protein
MSALNLSKLGSIMEGTTLYDVEAKLVDKIYAGKF